MRVAIAALILALTLPAQSKLTVAQLVSFLQSSIRLNHPDKQVANYLSKVRLSERLDERTIEDLQGQGIGPRTVEALRKMREESQGLPAPQPPAPKPAAPVIPPPSSEEQARVLEEVRGYALAYTKSLPDFICAQVIRRYYDESGMEFWALMDTLSLRLSYFNQKEDYKLMLVNNQTTTQSYESLGGATSTGEFGSLLKEVFEPKSHAAFQWERWATLRGRRTHVYSYQVAQQYSQWRVSYQRQLEIVPGYRGLVYVEKATNKVLRVTLEAVDIPPSFPIQQAATILDYDYVTISDREFLLPLKAVVRMREAKFLTKNEVEFRMYRKFSAEATIKFETPDALPEDQTKEQPAKP